LKFAVVDVQRAVMETEDGLRAQATLKKYFDKRQQELDAKQTELQKQREDIEKQSKVLSQQALQKRMEDWQKQMVELQTVFVEYNKELQKKQGELTQPIYGKVVALLRRLATQDGYDAILEKQAVPYMRNDLDLTDRVIASRVACPKGATRRRWRRFPDIGNACRRRDFVGERTAFPRRRSYL
jgi:outer membrane protein